MAAMGWRSELIVGFLVFKRNSYADVFRPVAQFGRAAVSKTAGWGFDSLLACQSYVTRHRGSGFQPRQR